MKTHATATASLPSIASLNLSSIDGGDNDRKRFNEAELATLADSLKREGLAQPITVRKIGRRYQVVCGERRFRAAKMAGWKAIPCIVKAMDDDRTSAVMLLENTARVNLSPIEEAEAYSKRQSNGWDAERIAETAGVTKETVARRLSLLTLPYMVQHLVGIGQFPVGHAEAMVKLDAQRQDMAFSIYRRSNNGLSLANFREITDRLQAEQDQGALFDLNDFFLEAVASAPAEPAGKAAQVSLAMNTAMPAMMQRSGKLGPILEAYASQLESVGMTAEALVVARVYQELVSANYARINPNLGTVVIA